MHLRPTSHAAVLGVALVLAAVACGAVAWRDTTRPYLAEVRIPVPGLAREVHILQVSDLHGKTFGRGQSRLRALVAGRRIDAVALTGDMRPSPSASLEPARELLRAVVPPGTPVLSVPGNHDGVGLTGGLRPAVPRISDERDVVPLAEGSVRVASFQTRKTAYVTWRGPVAEAALVVLTHVPYPEADVRRLAAETSATVVVLAGHTHGGQIRLPWLGSLIAPLDYSPYEDGPRAGVRRWILSELRGHVVHGLRHPAPNAYEYVSAGLGTYRLPLRFRDRASMTLVHLVPAP